MTEEINTEMFRFIKSIGIHGLSSMIWQCSIPVFQDARFVNSNNYNGNYFAPFLKIIHLRYFLIAWSYHHEEFFFLVMHQNKDTSEDKIPTRNGSRYYVIILCLLYWCFLFLLISSNAPFSSVPLYSAVAKHARKPVG